MSEKGTEEATEQRKQKAREKGDVVRSRELLGAVSMLAGVLLVGMTARQFVSGWAALYAQALALAMVRTEGESSQLLQQGVRIMLPSLLPVGFVLAASFAAALTAGLAQSGGLQVHPEAIGFKVERFNPVTNLGNIFSLHSIARMGKSLIPAAAVVTLGIKALRQVVLPMPVMSLMRLPAAFAASFDVAVDAAWVMVVWAGLDYAIERRSWNQKLRMTKQEMRDEIKESMGNPQMKMRIRRIQNAMRRRKVKADMSRASVVITNPTHYAVALEFSFESMLAPTVLAKGRDLHAAHIREEALWAGVPIVENPPLARSLYKSVDEGHAIPYELYAAVAGILAFLYRQQVEKAARDQKAADERAGNGTQNPTMAGGVTGR